VNALLGFRRIYGEVEEQRVDSRNGRAETKEICEAISLATCFYWKPVHCLQRSVVAARLLRKHGVNGRVVIGYRPSPFFSHAWVEVNGRVVNDSPAYKDRLHVLCTL